MQDLRGLRTLIQDFNTSAMYSHAILPEDTIYTYLDQRQKEPMPFNFLTSLHLMSWISILLLSGDPLKSKLPLLSIILELSTSLGFLFLEPYRLYLSTSTPTVFTHHIPKISEPSLI